MTDQNTDHAQLVAGDHNYSDSRWRKVILLDLIIKKLN